MVYGCMYCKGELLSSTKMYNHWKIWYTYWYNASFSQNGKEMYLSDIDLQLKVMLTLDIEGND